MLAHGIIGIGYMMLQGQSPKFGSQLTCSCEPQCVPKVQAVFIQHPPTSHGCLKDLVHLGKG